MRRFAELCDDLAATTKKSEKVRRLADYLLLLPLEDACLAALFLTGRVFSRWEEKTLAVGSALIWHAVAQLAGREPQALEVTYRKHGDLGAMAEEVLAGKTHPENLKLSEVAKALENLAASRGPSQKVDALIDLFRRCHPIEVKHIVKIITGELRIGVKESLVEEAIALAYGKTLAEVQRANMFASDIRETLQLAATERLAAARLQLFRPVSFMLATATDSGEQIMAACPSGVLVEDKYDGIRAQAHKAGGQVKIFSRTLDEVVEFPELIPALKALPGNFVLDGEIVGWREGRALLFTCLQTRLGRTQPDLWLPLEVPVRFFAFDLLYLNGEQLLDARLKERRGELEALLRAAPNSSIEVAPASFCKSAESVANYFDAALVRGNEGLVAKIPHSAYVPGRRGRFWLKLKRPMATLDVVVTAAEYGHGKRRGLLSDYTFAVRAGDRLLNVGKAYSGLTDEEIVRLTEFCKHHTIEDQGFRRLLEPTVVMEVAFNNLQRSPRHASGYALRFPRIVRLRPDKPVSEIDTLERVEELYRSQMARSSGKT